MSLDRVKRSDCEGSQKGVSMLNVCKKHSAKKRRGEKGTSIFEGIHERAEKGAD